MVAGHSGKLGKVYVKTAPYVSKEVSVIIGIVGDLQGEVVFTMDESCGLYLASKIMAGFEVKGLDDMSISAIKEIGNMISGNAASALFSHGTKVDITTPTFFKGTQGDVYSFANPGSKLICMPIHLEGEQVLEIDLHLNG